MNQTLMNKMINNSTYGVMPGMMLGDIRPSGMSIKGKLNIDTSVFYKLMNSDKNYTLDGKIYFVMNNEPFDMKYESIYSLLSIEDKRWNDAQSFRTKYEAKKYILERQLELAEENNDLDKIKELKNKLETFDIDNPELLV
jgi:hypothetical protein